VTGDEKTGALGMSRIDRRLRSFVSRQLWEVGALMTDAFVIETSDRAAGVAMRDGGGFQFFAADSQFGALEDCRFRSLRDLQARVDAIVAGKAQRVDRKIAYPDKLGVRLRPAAPT
jgi:hypothetical protein